MSHDRRSGGWVTRAGGRKFVLAIGMLALTAVLFGAVLFIHVDPVIASAVIGGWAQLASIIAVFYNASTAYIEGRYSNTAASTDTRVTARSIQEVLGGRVVDADGIVMDPRA